MQRILGVELVVIYNHSVTSQSFGHILSQYPVPPHYHPDDVGSMAMPLSVELRQTRAFTSDDVLLHMSPVINDCLYRYSALFQYFAVIDLDELIVPRASQLYTIPALITSLSAANGSSSGSPVASFTFRNAYFFLDIPVHEESERWRQSSELELSTYLVHRRRLTASPPAYSVNTIQYNTIFVNAVFELRGGVLGGLNIPNVSSTP